MFDLNRAVKDWRKALKAQPEIIDSDMDELEDHLREEFDTLKSHGLSDEEAFMVASRRLGPPEDLSGEFAIADPERRRHFRLSWMITGALALVFLWLAAEMTTNFGAGLFSRFNHVGFIPPLPMGIGWFAATLRIATLALGAFLVWRLLASDRSSRRLKNMNGGSIIGLAFLLGFLFLATRMASKIYVSTGTAGDVFTEVAVTNTWFNLFALLVLPALLLVGLWRLARS